MKKLLPIAAVVMVFIAGVALFQSFKPISTPDTKDFTITPFEAVSVGGAFQVFFTQDAVTTVKVEASAEDLEKVEMEVKDNELILRTKKNSNTKTIKIYLTTPNLHKVGIAGSGTFETTNTMTSSKPMHFEIAGSGTITAKIDAANVHSEIAGSGDIRLSGKAADTEVEIAGSGNYKSDDLTCANTDVEIAGSGSAYVNTSGKLKAQIAGSGSVMYTGKPSDIDKEIAGSGRVQQK